MMNNRDVEDHVKKIALAARRFKYYRPKDLVHCETEDNTRAICTDWETQNFQYGVFEMFYGHGDKYNKTELRARVNGTEYTFTSQTYAQDQEFDIGTCAELLFDAMKKLSTIKNDTQILDLTYANRTYQLFRQ